MEAAVHHVVALSPAALVARLLETGLLLLLQNAASKTGLYAVSWVTLAWVSAVAKLLWSAGLAMAFLGALPSCVVSTLSSAEMLYPKVMR